MKTLTALAYPDPLGIWTTARGVFERTDIEYHNDTGSYYDFIIANSPSATYPRYSKNEFIRQEISKGTYVINSRLDDISKLNVDFFFQKSFGYKLLVEKEQLPTLGRNIIIKSNKNSTHDGKIVEPPFSIDDPRIGSSDSVLSLEIRSRTDIHTDYRVCIFGYSCGLTNMARKRKEERFGGIFKSAISMHLSPHPESFFSSDEILKINNFCKNIGLEYGEIDVMRDEIDDKIYILDITSTPGGYYNFYGESAQYKSLLDIADAEKLKETIPEHYEKRFRSYIEEAIR